MSAWPAHLEGVEEVPEGPGVDDVVVHGQEEGDHHAGDACTEAEGAEGALPMGIDGAVVAPSSVPRDTPALTILGWQTLLQQVVRGLAVTRSLQELKALPSPLSGGWRLMTL